jgi:hypothetical protein
VAFALAVAGVVECEDAVAVAGEHADVRDEALAAAARAVAEQHGGAVGGGDVPGGQLAAVRGLDRDLLVRDAERGLLDRPARCMGGHQGDRERHDGEESEDGNGGQPAGAVGESPAERRPARRPVWGGDRGQAGGDQQQAAGDHADARDVGPVGARVHDVQAVRDDAEPERQQTDDDAEHEPGGPDGVRLGERPGGGHRDDAEHAEDRRVGPGEGEVEQVQRDQREAGQQQRPLEAREPRAAPP